jgi:hypothetical protein
MLIGFLKLYLIACACFVPAVLLANIEVGAFERGIDAGAAFARLALPAGLMAAGPFLEALITFRNAPDPSAGMRNAVAVVAATGALMSGIAFLWTVIV